MAKKYKKLLYLWAIIMNLIPETNIYEIYRTTRIGIGRRRTCPCECQGTGRNSLCPLHPQPAPMGIETPIGAEHYPLQGTLRRVWL